MKKLLLALGLAAATAATAAHAGIATNYLSYSLTFTPAFPLDPGPHSAHPYPPSLTLIIYETDAGTRILELENNTDVVDLSDIAFPGLRIGVAQPVWNAMKAGTNAVQFGTLTLTGVDISTNGFSATNVFESYADYKHYGIWDVSAEGGPDPVISKALIGASPFSIEAQEAWEEFTRKGPNVFDQGPAWGTGFAAPPYQKRVDVWPGFQDYLKTGRVAPLYAPTEGIPADFDDPADTSSVYTSTPGNTGAEGLIYIVIDPRTNHWEAIRLHVATPLSNGDTNNPH